MKRSPNEFVDLALLESSVFSDERGFLFKQFLPPGVAFSSILVSHNPIAGTVRGLHSQPIEREEFKLIACTKGRILDFLLDLRSNSDTYGDWCEVELSSKNSKSLLVPPGFAHGFQTLLKDTNLIYAVSGEYDSVDAITINITDSELEITLPLPISQISRSDSNSLTFADFRMQK